MNPAEISQELEAIRREVRHVRLLTMSDVRNQWITHAKVILNDCLIHLPDGELKNQVYDLIDEQTV